MRRQPQASNSFLIQELATGGFLEGQRNIVPVG